MTAGILSCHVSHRRRVFDGIYDPANLLFSFINCNQFSSYVLKLPTVCLYLAMSWLYTRMLG